MIDAVYLADIRRAFTNYRTLAERALEQITDEHLWTAIDSEANSIAVIMQHVAGNLRSRWDEAWRITLGSLDALTPDDLSRTIHIRGEGFAVVEALNRSITHTAYHVGQIVFLAKHFAGPGWRSLSIPKGRSADHTVGRYKQGIVPAR